MRNLKITIIGNSVALRTRPPEKFPLNKNYGQHLEEIIHSHSPDRSIFIHNKAQGATTIYNTIVKIDELIQTFPDFFIVNLGVVDASTREIPLWFYRLASNKRDRLIYNIPEFLYRNIIIKFRPILVKLRFKRSWISFKEYKRYFEILIKSLIKETNAKIIVLPINLANTRVEKALPGSLKKHIQYNNIMKSIALENDQEFIDLSFLETEKHFPDGIHYSTIGHKIVADEISKIIIKSLAK
ncbi:MAG TPA: hypothetical protein DCG75_18925 [Bacteroidales bacterium]|nr:hypothetical protein [Bacteroidales bacterium]